jgi:hypothetical protein
MLDVVAAVNDEAILTSNLKRSPLLDRPGVTLRLQKDYPSAALAYGAAMRECTSDIVVFAHQDAYLPGHWEDRLMEHVARIGQLDPAWAVLGLYGVRPDGSQVGYVWSSGLDSMVGASFDEPAPVVCIDEVLIVLRRSSGVGFDAALPGFHLYATDLVQTALSLGKGAYVVFAPIVHNSRPILYLGQDYFAAYDYVAKKWRHKLPIHNHVACIVKPGGLSFLRTRARHKFNELRYSHLDRKALDRHYDCVGIARRLGFE